MSKTLSFRVEIEFSEKITDDDAIAEIAKNIAEAIKHEASHGEGITPRDGEHGYCEIIWVTPTYLNDRTAIEHVV